MQLKAEKCLVATPTKKNDIFNVHVKFFENKLQCMRTFIGISFKHCKMFFNIEGIQSGAPEDTGAKITVGLRDMEYRILVADPRVHQHQLRPLLEVELSVKKGSIFQVSVKVILKRNVSLKVFGSSVANLIRIVNIHSLKLDVSFMFTEKTCTTRLSTTFG